MEALRPQSVVPCHQAHTNAGLPFDRQLHPKLRLAQELNRTQLPEHWDSSTRLAGIHSRQSPQPCVPLKAVQGLDELLPDRPFSQSRSAKQITLRSENDPEVQIKREHSEMPIVRGITVPAWRQVGGENGASSLGTSMEIESESAGTPDPDLSDSSSDTSSDSRLPQAADIPEEETNIPPAGYALSHLKDFTLTKVFEALGFLSPLGQYIGCNGGTAHSSNARQGQDNSSQGKSPSERSRHCFQPNKRKDRDDGETPSDGGKTGKRSRTSAEGDEPTFACPYLKQCPLKYYRKCSSADLKTTARVKQHLARNHVRPPYCPDCGEIFAADKARDDHVRCRDCEAVDPLIEPDGISTETKKRLSKRSDSVLDEVGRWFAMWDILFPGQPHPESPFLTIQDSLGVTWLNQYVLSTAPRVIAGRLYGLEPNPLAEQVIYEALQDVTRQFESVGNLTTLLTPSSTIQDTPNSSPESNITLNHSLGPTPLLLRYSTAPTLGQQMTASDANVATSLDSYQNINVQGNELIQGGAVPFPQSHEFSQDGADFAFVNETISPDGSGTLPQVALSSDNGFDATSHRQLSTRLHGAWPCGNY